MRGNGDSHVVRNGAVIRVRPQVLRDRMYSIWRGRERRGARTRTEYCRPARIHGDSDRVKNILLGLSRVFMSMKTVPFCVRPLQYC
jgi:hypothetical protein